MAVRETKVEIIDAVIKEGQVSKNGKEYNSLLITYKNGKKKSILMSDIDVVIATRQ